MQNQRLVCCLFCSKKLTRNWEESHCGIPYNEYQTCEDHHTVSVYSWPAFIKSVDVRTIDVIEKFPREEKISPDEIKYLYSSELDKILMHECHNIDWNNQAIYDRSNDYNRNIKKMYPNLINFEMYYYSLKEKYHS